MKTRCLAVVALIFLGLSARAGDGKFSLEVGTGIQPLHMTFSPTSFEKEALAKLGQRAMEKDSFCPVFSINGAWRVTPHWELCATAGASTRIYQYVQYGTFGIDPQGQPRYDLNNGSVAGWKPSVPVATIAFQARFIWSPKWDVMVYSALGVGLTTVTDLIPIPEITPIALRFGQKKVYFFAEATIGSIATFAHGGIGWHF